MAVSGSSIHIGSDSLDLTCDVCKYQNITTVAISYCNLCQEALCTACDRVHRAARQTRGHKLLTGNQLLSISIGNQTPAMMTCDKHHMMIQYYCEADDALCCSKCKITTHSGCTTTDIDEYTKQHKPNREFRSMKESLKNLEKSFEKLGNKKNRDKAALKQQTQKCLDKMQKIRKEFDKLLTELEKKMAKEIQDLEKKIDKELDDHLTMVNDTLRHIRVDIGSLRDCERTGRNEALFVGVKKTKPEIAEYEKVIISLEQELHTVDVQFCQDSLVTKTLNELTNLGQVRNIGRKDSDISFPNMKLTDMSRHDIEVDRIQSVVFLPDGHVVLACAVDGLILLDEEFLEHGRINMRAIQACKASDNEVVVTTGIHKQIQFVDVVPKFQVTRTIQLDRVCSGVDFHEDDAYVTCHNGPGDGEVLVLSRNGDLKRRLGVNNGMYMFQVPFDVKVSKNGNKVFVSDKNNHTVTALDQRGQVAFKFSDSDLNAPMGLLPDHHDNLLVCGDGSCNVLVITSDGRKHKILINRDDDIKNPLCISYRDSDGCLAIGLGYNDTHRLVTMKVVQI